MQRQQYSFGTTANTLIQIGHNAILMERLNRLSTSRCLELRKYVATSTLVINLYMHDCLYTQIYTYLMAITIVQLEMHED